MAEVHRHFIDANGGYIDRPFNTQQQADAWPKGETETEVFVARPSEDHIWSEQEGWILNPNPPAPESYLVDLAANRRLVAGIPFGGHVYQSDPDSKQRITGAATLAGFAIAAGKQAGDYRWADPDADFEWIVSDNTRVKLDAPGCFALGQAAAKRERDIIFAARTIKDMNPIPADYDDDSRWPT